MEVLGVDVCVCVCSAVLISFWKNACPEASQALTGPISLYDCNWLERTNTHAPLVVSLRHPICQNLLCEIAIIVLRLPWADSMISMFMLGSVYETDLAPPSLDIKKRRMKWNVRLLKYWFSWHLSIDQICRIRGQWQKWTPDWNQGLATRTTQRLNKQNIENVKSAIKMQYIKYIHVDIHLGQGTDRYRDAHTQDIHSRSVAHLQCPGPRYQYSSRWFLSRYCSLRRTE